MSDRFNAFEKNDRKDKPNKKRWNKFKKPSEKGDTGTKLKQNNRWTTFEKTANSDKDNNRFSDRNEQFHREDGGWGEGGKGGRFHRHGNKFHKRQKRIYKSRHTKEEFFNKMETRGSRQMGISLFDSIVKKEKSVKNTANKAENTANAEKNTENKDMKLKEKQNTKKLNANKTGFENEKMTDNMKQFILNQCYETDSEEEDEFSEINEKKDDAIGFL
jgi:hypothetical protein